MDHACKFVESIFVFFRLESCREWDGKHRAMGVGNHLVRGCPRQMSGGAQVASRSPHSEDDDIGFGVQSCLQYAFSRRAKLDRGFG